ncbi:MAG: CdaR family protein [Chloroflexota bacterium]|nr:CdaR family protein [Chloroflexota bacterium]
MKEALRWIASNLPLMILALILAALTWVMAVEEGDRTIEERYSQPIPITLLEPPDGMLIMGEFDDSVQVTVRAPKSVWDSLKVEDFAATIDLTGLGTGNHQVPVQVTLNKQPSRVVLFEPEYITLELDVRAERSVPVHVQTEGNPALGYLRRAMTAEPNEVLVSGPSTYVTQVTEAFASVSVQDANADIEKELQLRPQDSEEHAVPHVTLAPDAVNVRIPIELSSYYSHLPVKVVLEGQVAPGYRVTDISVEPPEVTVFGNPDVLEALPGYIEAPVDAEGAQTDIVIRPALNVPPNVAVVSDQQAQQVEVRVFIEAIQSSLTMEIIPELQGLRPGLTATVSLENVEVILSGPLPLLETLETGDVRVVLDLFGLQPGTHQLEPQIVVPEGLTAQNIIPATVQVEILTAPTPTPTEN